MMRFWQLLINGDRRSILTRLKKFFDEVENDLVMQKLWEAYCKKFSYASDLEWDVIMKAIHRLYVLCEKGISV